MPSRGSSRCLILVPAKITSRATECCTEHKSPWTNDVRKLWHLGNISETKTVFSIRCWILTWCPVPLLTYRSQYRDKLNPDTLFLAFPMHRYHSFQYHHLFQRSTQMEGLHPVFSLYLLTHGRGAASAYRTHGIHWDIY